MTARPSRPAYTLLEMALTTALIGVIAAISYPSIQGMYGHHKLTAGVDAVRAAWASGRSRAMAEGRPYRFSVALGKGTFRLAPDDPEFWSGSPPLSADAPALVLEDALPDGVTFGGAAAEGGTSDLAVFQPDGTARNDVELVFQFQGAPRTTLQLRAMTGAVTVKGAGGEQS